MAHAGATRIGDSALTERTMPVKPLLEWFSLRVYQHGWLQHVGGTKNDLRPVVVYACESTLKECETTLSKLIFREKIHGGFRPSRWYIAERHTSRGLVPVWTFHFWKLLFTRTVCQKCPDTCHDFCPKGARL